MRNLCFGSDRFIHHELGFNYRMTNMQAALGLAQLSRIKKIISKKKKIGKIYYQYLKKNDDLLYIQKPIYKGQFQILVRDEDEEDRQDITSRLAKIPRALGVNSTNSFKETQALILTSPMVLNPIYTKFNILGLLLSTF